MHYKYVWRGLEEMFKFAHLHGKTGISTILNALFGVVFILLYQSVLNWCVIPVLFHRKSSPFEGKGESPKWRQHLPLSPDNLVHPPTSACDPHSTPLLAFPWHKTQLLNRQSRPSSSDNLAHSHRNLIFPSDISP